MFSRCSFACRRSRRSGRTIRSWNSLQIGGNPTKFGCFKTCSLVWALFPTGNQDPDPPNQRHQTTLQRFGGSGRMDYRVTVPLLRHLHNRSDSTTIIFGFPAFLSTDCQRLFVAQFGCRSRSVRSDKTYQLRLWFGRSGEDLGNWLLDLFVV